MFDKIFLEKYKKEVVMFERRHRFILHSDLNNFYASVECKLNPKIKDKAVVIVGNEALRHGVVLAKNYIAKSYGIKTGDTAIEAQNKCGKDVKLVKITARLWLYEKISRKVQQIYRTYTDNVEMFGIDEAWLDITPTVHSYTEALEIAESIRQEVRQKIGLTVSIGVSYNKIFAKLGSDLKKPDAITLITKGNFRDRIWPLPANTLLLIGRQTTKKLEKMNILTIGDLAKTNVTTLEKIFGINGRKLWNFANGLDADSVKNIHDEDEIKSIGNSTTCPRDLISMQDITTVFYNLAEQVSCRLKEKNLYCNEIQIFVKNNELTSVEHQTKLPYPTNTSADIGKYAIQLFNKTCDLNIPIRALGIRLRDFSTELQTSLFGDGSKLSKNEQIDKTIDNIRKKYGNLSISRGNNLIF